MKRRWTVVAVLAAGAATTVLIELGAVARVETGLVSSPRPSRGARDAERSRRSQQPRVVVLGDSFLEGWGARSSQRLSNRLEEATGLEHLNFAMAHLGPYQSYLAYRSLARSFDHEAVVLGILPANDFADPALPWSYFYDFRERDVARLEAVLARLVRETEGKRLAIVLIPTLADLKRYEISGEDPLSQRLRDTGSRPGFR